MKPAVFHELSYFTDAVFRDSCALLDGERMIGRFEFDIAPDSYLAGVNMSLQEKGVGVNLNSGRQPSEIVRFSNPLGVFG
jgi:hypothetical protein